MRKFALYLMVFGIFFIAFHKVDSEKLYNDNYADYPMINFSRKTLEGKELVLRDNSSEYGKFHVITFGLDGNYTAFIYKYLRNPSEYINEYRRYGSAIVDYNYDELMIRYIDSTGLSTYEETLNNYQDLIDKEVYSIIR